MQFKTSKFTFLNQNQGSKTENQFSKEMVIEEVLLKSFKRIKF